ncbi:MAG: sulfite exporter TauE/SafE family protein [Candidatus Limnocylindrales bacterium]
MLPDPLLILLGIAVGTFGTLVGAGGGFVLVPLLAILEPALATAAITGVSLAVVAMNATSGALAYARDRRIDYRSGILFALATLPGSILGALATKFLERRFFDIAFALLLLGLAVLLIRRGEPTAHAEPADGIVATRWHPQRDLTDRAGTRHRYRVHLPLGVAVSFVVGFASSLLGIGGGVIHVPVLIGVLGFPTHIATATSHFVLAIMATAGTVTHVLGGDLDGLARQTILLGVGAVVGAQIGARLSTRVHGLLIVRALAVALAVVGLRLGAQSLFGR